MPPGPAALTLEPPAGGLARVIGLGVGIATPFMHLSFLALSVIPELRITDRGLVNVQRFALTGVAPG